MNTQMPCTPMVLGSALPKKTMLSGVLQWAKIKYSGSTRIRLNHTTKSQGLAFDHTA